MSMIPAVPHSVPLDQGGAIPQPGFAVFQVKEDPIAEVLDTALAAGSPVNRYCRGVEERGRRGAGRPRMRSCAKRIVHHHDVVTPQRIRESINIFDSKLEAEDTHHIMGAWFTTLEVKSRQRFTR